MEGHPVIRLEAFMSIALYMSGSEAASINETTEADAIVLSSAEEDMALRPIGESLHCRSEFV
jgi:hypothetical protein